MIATNEDLKFERFLRRRKKLVWKDASGTEVFLEKLTDQHLENILNYMNKSKMESTKIQPSSLNFY
jgi:hypothetical protein